MKLVSQLEKAMKFVNKTQYFKQRTHYFIVLLIKITMNSKVFDLKNSLDVLVKFKKNNDDLDKFIQIIDSFQMMSIKSVTQNVNILCKTSVKPIDCKNIFENKEKSKFKCFWPNCRYEAKDNANLIQHKSNHLNERQFVCDFSECNKTFKHKHHLIRHKRTHSGEKPFKCDFNGCGQRCWQREYLILHKRIHTGEKPYKCDYNNCGKKYSQKSSLSQHKKRHLKYKSFKCNENHCNKCFVTLYDLKRHKNSIHSTEKPFKCLFENYGKKYGNKSGLTHHSKTLHKIV